MSENAAYVTDRWWGDSILLLAFTLLLTLSGRTCGDETKDALPADDGPVTVAESGQVKPDSSQKTASAEQGARAEKPESPASTDPKQEESKGTDLLAGELSDTWGHFSAKETTAVGDVWKVIESADGRHLICSGVPNGFLFTKKEYSNFDLTFEWKYESDPNANSGVLVYTQKERRLWPTSMQVQLHQPHAGSIFSSGDAKSDNTTEPPSILAADVGQWNKCHVKSINGVLTVEINDRKAGEVSGCKPAKGFIALQSEGSETHFRRLILRELPAESSPVDPVKPVVSPETQNSTIPGSASASPEKAAG